VKSLLITGIFKYLWDYFQYCIVLFWLIGVGIGLFLSLAEIKDDKNFLLIIFTQFAVSLVILYTRVKISPVKLVTILIVCILGLLYTCMRIGGFESDSALVNRLDKKSVDLEVHLVNLPKKRNDKSIYTFESIGTLGNRVVFITELPAYEVIDFTQECVVKVLLMKADQYYFTQGIYLKGEVTQINCTERTLDLWSSFLQVGLNARDYVQKISNENLPEPQASIMYGILTGDNPVFSKGFQEDLRNVGVMHIVAASGFNVIVISALLKKITARFPRSIGLVTEFLTLLIYVVIAGFSASIIRAVIMYFIVSICKVSGRKSLALLSLLYTALVFSVVNPFILVSASFLLSFSATLGLILFMPVMNYILPKASESVKSTFSATLATAPVSAFLFGTFSLTGILANLIVVPAIENVMLWSIVAIFLDLFSKPLSRIVFSAILILLKYFEICVSYFSLYGLVSLSSTVQNNFLSLLLIFLTFLAVIILIIKEDIFENHSYYFKSNSK
jgi:ComEC/Rec2-related protein